MDFVDILSAKQHSSLNYCPGLSRLSCSPSLSASTGIRRLSLAFFITYSNRHLNFWDLLLLMSVSSWGLRFPSIICRSPGYNMLSSCLRFDFYLKLTGVSSSLSPIPYTYYFLYFFYQDLPTNSSASFHYSLTYSTRSPKHFFQKSVLWSYSHIDSYGYPWDDSITPHNSICLISLKDPSSWPHFHKISFTFLVQPQHHFWTLLSTKFLHFFVRFLSQHLFLIMLSYSEALLSPYPLLGSTPATSSSLLHYSNLIFPCL